MTANRNNRFPTYLNASTQCFAWSKQLPLIVIPHMRGCVFYLLLSACTNNKCLLGILFSLFPSLFLSPSLFPCLCFFFTVWEMPSRADTLYCMGLLIDDKQRVHKGKESGKKRESCIGRRCVRALVGEGFLSHLLVSVYQCVSFWAEVPLVGATFFLPYYRSKRLLRRFVQVIDERMTWRQQ